MQLRSRAQCNGKDSAKSHIQLDMLAVQHTYDCVKIVSTSNSFLAEPHFVEKDRFHRLQMGEDQKAEPTPLTST